LSSRAPGERHAERKVFILLPPGRLAFDPVFATIRVMALAIIVTLEKELPDAVAAYAKVKSGRALAREIDRLNLAARTKKVPAIESFLSESVEKLRQQLREDGFDPEKMRLPPEQWFSAADGLAMVRALHEHVSANLNDFKQPNPILKDLKAVDAQLTAAHAAGVRFHFSKTEL
jgi:hypothetical protein